MTQIWNMFPHPFRISLSNPQKFPLFLLKEDDGIWQHLEWKGSLFFWQCQKKQTADVPKESGAVVRTLLHAQGCSWIDFGLHVASGCGSGIQERGHTLWEQAAPESPNKVTLPGLAFLGPHFSFTRCPSSAFSSYSQRRKTEPQKGLPGIRATRTPVHMSWKGALLSPLLTTGSKNNL